MCCVLVKCFKWVAVTLNVILLIVGVVVTIFGVILWKTDFKTYDDKIESYIPPALSKDGGSIPDVPGIFPLLGKFVVSVGIIIMVLAFMGIMAFTCCASFKCCLVFYLILLVILTIMQIVVVALSYNTGTIEDKINKILMPIFTKDHEKNEKFILATELFLKCCGIKGAQDYYCTGIYDAFCNWNCKQPLDKSTKSLPVCQTGNREPEKILEKIYSGYDHKTSSEKSKDQEECSKMKKDDFEKYEQNYQAFPDKLIEYDDGKIAKWASDFEGCGEKLYGKLRKHIKVIQIICLVILLIEVFDILVVACIMVNNRKDDSSGKHSK